MDLTPRQRRALEAICDTFAPATLTLPSASAMGVPAAVLSAIEMNPRLAERRQFARLLSLWDTPLLTAFGGGGFRRFSRLSPERRERVLLTWADSRLRHRRAAFLALRKAALMSYYMLPVPGSGDCPRSPIWEALRYPGPLGPPAISPKKAIAPLAVTKDLALDCDVCVVGSGAGGGTAAGVLASAGIDVVVLEAGSYYDAGDFDGGELEGFRRMYLGAGGAATIDRSVELLAGVCLGGGTVINYTTSFRTPDEVREEWAGHGVPAFATREYERSLDAVCERLGVNREHSAVSARERVVERGLRALGWHVDTMPRNVRGCDQGIICGYCGYGCRLGAKRSTVRTWLADAAAAGARILIDTRAERVIARAGAAAGVEARTAGGHRVTVRARAVIAACGAINTPALLKRSGLANPNIGRHLKLHPVTAVCGLFDEEIRPWEGTMQAIYSDQHRYLDGAYGVKYETTATHPSLPAAFAPWRSAREHRDLMARLPHLVALGVLLRDRDGGTVGIGRDGHPIVRYRLSPYDRRHLRIGVAGAAEILEAAGARTIVSSHTRRVAYEPGRGSRARFLEDADACGWDTGRVTLYSFHIMASARMGGSRRLSACDPRGQTWDLRDLYICDGSAFPTASGVNPMISIEAIAHMNASALAGVLR